MYWMAAAFWALLIGYLSLVPGNRLPHFSFPHIDKLEHFACYGILTLLLILAQQRSPKFFLKHRHLFKIWLCSAAYGLLLELLQHWCTTSRQFDLYDVLANSAGAALGLAFGRLLLNYKSTGSILK
ncbi:MAG: VanZ family protein [Chitinophagales bacterium]